MISRSIIEMRHEWGEINIATLEPMVSIVAKEAEKFGWIEYPDTGQYDITLCVNATYSQEEVAEYLEEFVLELFNTITTLDLVL